MPMKVAPLLLGVERRLGFLPEVLQHAGPAAVHILAHGGAALCAHHLELAVLELDQGRLRSFGHKPHFDLRTDRRIGLPMGVDVPTDHEAMGRLPDLNPPHLGFRTVLGQLVPTAAHAWLHDDDLHRSLADPGLVRPPAIEPGREDVESVRLTRMDADALANWRDCDLRRRHFSVSSLWVACRSNSA